MRMKDFADFLSLLWLGAWLLTLAPGGARGYAGFRERIPNGARVPHPCDPGLWKGVGHRLAGGTGALNAFGNDFKASGEKWTRALCEKDSDGDGLSNGQELGDPQCVWSPGLPPNRTDYVTHPGICTPFESGKCQLQNSWVQCSDLDEVWCPATLDKDTILWPFQMANYTVSEAHTQWVQVFMDLPYDEPVDLVAYNVLVKSDLVHHIVLFGCKPDEGLDKPRGVPLTKHGVMIDYPVCPSTIAGWQVGQKGYCLNNQTGFRLGRTGFTSLMMEIHYDNKLGVSGVVETSGLMLYLTKKLRPYSSIIFDNGNRLFSIPPGQQNFRVPATCPGNCTKKLLTQPVFVTLVMHHMHLAGIRARTELVTAEGKTIVLAEDDPYVFNGAMMHPLPLPQEFRPGDTLRTICTYDTTSRRSLTVTGPDTQDEMCMGYISVYPSSALLSPFCSYWGNMDHCAWMEKSKGEEVLEGCHVAKFPDPKADYPERDQLFHMVMENCNKHGACRPECAAILPRVLNHPCLRGQLGEGMRVHLERSLPGMTFLSAVQTCQDCPAVTLPCRPEPCVDVLFFQDSASSLPLPALSAPLLLLSALHALL